MQGDLDYVVEWRSPSTHACVKFSLVLAYDKTSKYYKEAVCSAHLRVSPQLGRVDYI